MSTANNQQASSISQRKWLSPLPALVGLVFLQVANGGLPTAVAQPPEARANDIAYLVPEIDAEWQRLRAEMGLREFTAPQETITRYQQFFEQKGVRSAATSVKITGVIAQIYWQQLKDRKKALEIYHWALEKYAGLPIVENLRRERDMVANASSPNDIVSIAPVVIAGQNEGKAVATATVTLNPSQVGAKPGVAPVTVGNSFTPVTVTAIRGQEGRGSTPVLLFVETTLSSTERLPEVEVDNSAVGQEATSMLSVVNPRLAALNGYLTQWRAGKISWEQLIKDSQFQANDVILLTSQSGLISMYRADALLREKLGETMRSFPELYEDWAKLSPTAQIILANDCVRQKNPLAKTIYEALVQLKKMPDGVWWNKERLTYHIGLYHAALGDYAKAAESNIEIAAFTKNNAWRDDSFVVAARYYNKAGQSEKATELYKQAERSKYGWARGLALFDQARLQIKKKNYVEARHMLQEPVEGGNSDQMQVVLNSTLAYTYYLTGDWADAKKYANLSLEQLRNLKKPLDYDGVNDDMQSQVLEWTKKWKGSPIYADKSELVIQGIKSGSTVRRRIVLTAHHPVPLEITADNPDVKVVLDPEWQTSPFYSTIGIEATVNCDGEGIQEYGTITARSAEHHGISIHIPIRVAVTPIITSFPSTIFVANLERNKEIMQSITLHSTRPFSIVRTDTTQPNVKVSVLASEDRKNYTLSVSFNTSQVKGNYLEGKIRILTDDPASGEMNIAYFLRLN